MLGYDVEQPRQHFQLQACRAELQHHLELGGKVTHKDVRTRTLDERLGETGREGMRMGLEHGRGLQRRKGGELSRNERHS